MNPHEIEGHSAGLGMNLPVARMPGHVAVQSPDVLKRNVLEVQSNTRAWDTTRFVALQAEAY